MKLSPQVHVFSGGFPEFRPILDISYVYLTGCKTVSASVNVCEKRVGNGHFVHCLKSFLEGTVVL